MLFINAITTKTALHNRILIKMKRPALGNILYKAGSRVGMESIIGMVGGTA